MSKNIIIAIDGHSSCGKSTLAKSIAKELNYIYIDSGAMYRAVAFYVLENKLISNQIIDTEKIIEALSNIQLSFHKNESNQQVLFLNNENIEEQIRKPEVAEIVSLVAEISPVRKKLVEIQRKLSENTNIVMDGRDIGSVVFPNAQFKFFITAKPEVRAKRRFDELSRKQIKTTLEEVYQNLLERDRIDSNRKDSPLIKCEDAILIDNSDMSKNEQLLVALKHIQSSAVIL